MTETIQRGFQKYLNFYLLPKKNILSKQPCSEYDHIAVLMSSYDDAAFHLDEGAKDLLEGFGFRGGRHLGFRDNFAFFGNEVKSFEKVIKFDQNVLKNNKYAEWPDRVEVSGCFQV